MSEELSKEISELQIHKSMVEKGSALDIIREKELEINAKVLEARKQAEDILAEARRKAVAIKEKAAGEGPKEAKAYFDAEIAKVQKKADKIGSSVEDQVNEVITDGMKNFDKAVGKVEAAIIP